MKELSIEEKAKAYEEALERAREIHKDTWNSYILDIFPELAECEGEDEKIRKWIINSIEDYHLVSPIGYETKMCKKALAWLEKQGEQNPVEYSLEQAANIFLDALSKTPYNNKPITDAQVITKELLKFLFDANSYNPDALNKQKSIDNVEPKFKVGDWIINEFRDICLITDIDLQNGYYICESNRFGNTDGDIDLTDKAFHLWTIQDANDGDVLVNGNRGVIALVYKVVGNNIIQHCYFSKNANALCINGAVLDGRDFYPAKQTQRENLFNEIKDAEYEWDEEKKILRKIEKQPSQWNISDYRTWQYIVSDVLTKYDGIGQYLDDGFCKKIARYMQENWSKKLSLRQTPAWNGEDDYNVQCCIAKAEKDITNGYPGRNQELIDWLKSLKPRMEEQQ